MKFVLLPKQEWTVVNTLGMTIMHLHVFVSISMLHMIMDIMNVSVMVLLNMMLS